MGKTTTTNDKPNLITFDQATRLSVEEVQHLFQDHINPGQYKYLRLLGFHRIIISKAEGMYYYDQNNRAILDFFGGFGSLAFGHNHPRILALRKRFAEEKRHDIAIAFMSQYATSLARNLAAIAPEDLDMVFLASTGAEAVEYALKIAEKAQGPTRSVVAYAEKAFHGKTRGALSVTDSPLYRSSFTLLQNTIKVPFGDSKNLEETFKLNPQIGTLILETVQGGAGVIPATAEYWREVRRLCDQYKIIWISDEVQCGVGRTGKFFAFEHAQVCPDIITLAKSLGGGKAAIGATITRREIFKKTYGPRTQSITHVQATFGGMGETCATSIEALNILYDENLLENCRIQGDLLISELRRLAEKYPNFIKEVRGQGLMVGLEFQDISNAMPLGFRSASKLMDGQLKGSLCGFVGSLLLSKYNILVAFTEYNRNVIRLEPALIVNSEQIEQFIAALEDLLSQGLVSICKKYADSFFGFGKD